MARPALSASRGIEIIDFLAAFPERAFTLSEIARAANINVSSCHSVLHALLARGYLSHGATPKTYVLGPALIAAGKAALGNQTLIARAQQAAEDLVQEHDQPVLLSAVIGDEILGIITLANTAGRRPDLRVGERIPLVPPAGASFLAWSPAAAIDAWIAKRRDCDKATAASWRRGLALTRQRGFQVTLRVPGSKDHASLMAEMTARRGIHEYRSSLLNLMSSSKQLAVQPDTIEPEAAYAVLLIAAPIFNERGEAAYCLSFSGMAKPMSGATLQRYADSLVRASLKVMRADLALRA